MVSKVNEVQAFFERPAHYLNRRAFEIRVRAETVKELVKATAGVRILDIGCGDGSISLPLLTETTNLTLVDLSSRMLSLAKSKVPREVGDNVVTVNKDFMNTRLPKESFDLILCIGVLAHVNCPADFIAEMVSLLKPGGSLIVECTDSGHVLTRLVALFHKVWGLFRPTAYALNAVSFSEITRILGRYHLLPEAEFRYAAPLPGNYRLFSPDLMYECTRQIFGSARSNRNVWLGNESICLFRSLAPRARN